MESKKFEELVKEYSFGDLVTEIYIRKIVNILNKSNLSPITILKITIGVAAITREQREEEELKKNFRKVQIN